MLIIKNLASKIIETVTLVIASLISMTVSLVGLLRFFNPLFTSFMIWESNFFEEKVYYNWTAIRDIGENITLSVVATEDSNFCDQLGVDIKEVYRVIKQEEKRGGSTITQQLAKNIFYGLGDHGQENL